LAKKLDETIHVESTQHIFIEYKVGQPPSGKAVKVHQSFVVVANKQTNQEIVEIAQIQGRQHRVHLSLPSHSAQLHQKSGKYEVNIFVGDFYVEKSISWSPLSIQISFPNTTNQQDQSPFAMKAPIEWTFRAPDSRASKTLSFVFTLAVLSPWIVLLIGLPAVGANLKNFPGGTTSFFALGFVGGLGAILLLYALYWFQLNMMQTLLYLSGLAIPTFFCGFKTLNHLAGSGKSKTD